MSECEHILQDLPDYVRGVAEPKVAATVELHLRSCAACQAESRCFRKLDELLAAHLQPLPASAAFASTFAGVLEREIAAAESQQEENLDRLLADHLAPIAVSPAFSASFANRLAAEVAAEEARSISGRIREVFGWLLRPWAIPAYAAAVLALVVLGYILRSAPSLSPEVAIQPRMAAREQLASGKASARRASERESAPVNGGSRIASREENKVPPEVLKNPGFFVDYAIIQDLDLLEHMEGARDMGSTG